MKIIAIGDIHGEKDWKKIVEQEKDADRIVFMGDYFDSFEPITGAEQIDNFKEILRFKQANDRKAVLLIGNHDFHYLRGVEKRYSGFQPVYYLEIQEVLEHAIQQGWMDMCYDEGKYLFTHAGISWIWVKNNFMNFTNYNVITIAVNELFHQNRDAFEFSMGKSFSQTGDDTTQTPIWIRPASLEKSIIPDYIQVVGHTQQENLSIRKNIILIDTLNTSGEYLIITDGNPGIGKIENTTI